MCAWRWGGATGVKSRQTEVCRECGSVLFRQGEEMVCPNPDCPAQLRAALRHWCSAGAMDIPGVDEPLVALLVERGLARDVAELYRVKVAELAGLPGVNRERAQTVFDAITASLKREAWRLLFGLGIPGVGAVEAQSLGRGFPTVDAVFAAGEERLIRDAGVNPLVARSVARWYADGVNRKLIRRMEKLGLNFKSELYRPSQL